MSFMVHFISFIFNQFICSTPYSLMFVIVCRNQWRIWDFKKGGKFLLATSAHTKRGPNQVFQIFLMVKKKFFGQGARPNGPPTKYATDRNKLT